MIRPIGAGKGFDKMKHSFVIKKNEQPLSQPQTIDNSTPQK